MKKIRLTIALLIDLIALLLLRVSEKLNPVVKKYWLKAEYFDGTEGEINKLK